MATIVGFFDSLHEVMAVRSGAATGNGWEDEVVAAIDDDAHLWKTSIGHRFPLFLALSASADEVVASVMRFESAAVDGGETPFAPGELRVSPLHHCGVEKSVGRSLEEESIGGFVQGGEVWDRFEFNDATEVAAVLEEFGYAAIVGLQEFLRASSIQV
jgi:hypothetical protein